MNPSQEEALAFIEEYHRDPDTLSKDRQAAILHHFPQATLPVVPQEEAQAPVTPPRQEEGPSDEELYQEISGLWSSGGEADIPECMRQAHPGLLEERIRAAIERVRAEKTEGDALKVSVEVAHWDEANQAQATLSYQNDPGTGIFALTKRIPMAGGGPPRERMDSITPFYISTLTRHENPLDPAETIYSVLLKHSENPRGRIHYEEASLESITADLASNQAGVRDKNKVHSALSSLLDKFETEGKVKIKASIPATGFFEDQDGKIYLSHAKAFPIHPPVYNRRQTRKALEALEEIAKFYAVGGDPTVPGSCDHFLTALFFIIGAPLGFIRKQAGVECKILLLTGIPHTGKTLIEKISAAIWGLPEQAAVIGAAKLTPPQFATHVNSTTFPISFDEVRTVLSNPVLADLLKSSTTGILVKERILAKQGFRRQQFFAYASVVLSCNYLPELHIGVNERIIPVEFTARHRKSEESAKKFDKYLHSVRDTLPAIGAALSHVFLTKWPRVRDLILQPEQVKAGYELLFLLYTQEGLPLPEWVREVTVKYDLEAKDPVQQVCDFLREEFLKALRAHYDRKDIPIGWDKRLNFVKEGNILPPYVVNISDKNIVVAADLFASMAKTGREIPGGLTGLRDRVNLFPEQTRKIDSLPNYKGRKALAIDRKVFYAFCEAPTEFQEELEVG